ncbi:MAG: hypothetical protein QW478_05540 [Candidatus Micrarchaeaceae archaeon]
MSFYSALQDRLERLSSGAVKKWGKPRDACTEIMSPYKQFISCEVQGQCIITGVNRCVIAIITFTGSHDAPYVPTEGRKRDFV